MSDRQPVMQPEHNEPQTVGEKIGESIRSEDRPIEKTQPQAPLALVMGSYPIILIILLMGMAAFFVFSRRGTTPSSVDTPAATEVPVESSLSDPNP